MKKLIGVIAASLLGAGVAGTAQAACPPVSEAVAHRGGTEVYTENTRKAWNDSMARGAGWVETDVQFTKDNVPVMIHDESVDRTTNGVGDVNTLTLSQLRALRTSDGQYVPTLYEFLSDVKAKNVRAFVELKTNPTAVQWSAFNARFNWLDMKSRTVVTSFDKQFLLTVKTQGYVTGWIDELGDRAPADITPYATYYLKHHWSVTYDRYKKWTAAGLKVYPWTVNQTADWDRFKYAPGLVTDKPRAYKTWQGTCS